MVSSEQPEEPIKNLGLLSQRRFAPFFATQFLGAFNDNLFKNSLLLLVAYDLARFSSAQVDVVNNLAAGLFILPFFVFSALAGQLADRIDKAKLIRCLKFGEILIMATAAVAFYFESLAGLLLVLFLMGSQSAFFGPVKYAIIPQHLRIQELVNGNGLVEMGTFMAILLGTAFAGVLMQLPQATFWVSFSVVMMALFGWLVSRQVPAAPSVSPDLRLDWNLIRASFGLMRYARQSRALFLSILGISWFWFLGAAYLTQLPNFTREMLGADKSVVTLLLCLFSIGIGLGSVLCGRLSAGRIEVGLVPVGAAGISLWGLDLYFACHLPVVETLRGLAEFIKSDSGWRVMLDLTLIGLFGGFFIVPLYASIQKQTAESHRARVIAANNILNALLMVISALTGILLLGMLGFDLAQFFLFLALANLLVAGYIFVQVPEFGMRFMVWAATHAVYRVSSTGLRSIPDKGPALLVCNHVSYMDALILAGVVKRPVRFVMINNIYRLPVLNYVFRAAKTIPISSRQESPETYQQAFDAIGQALDDGQLVCVFPEGQLTRDGELQPFKAGILKVLAKYRVPVVPMALSGLWGSLFSYGWPGLHGGLSFRRQVKLAVGTALEADRVLLDELAAQVGDLREHR